MSPNDWGKINELFHRALELPSVEREDFLRENCVDELIRAEVVELLAAQNDESFLQSPVFETGLEFIAAPENHAGERIGAYQIIGELGRGGMGAVYQAFRADGAFERRVAVKLLPKNNLSDALKQKFQRERQILANLNHPFIARLFDGGETVDGTPYFVMELVGGSSIIEYCRENNLSVDSRLQLFLKVCAAVEYAHEQGVIHRDLKPSNILIADDGTPKLLDFGIAKFLSNAANGDETTSGFSFLTPEYASPEQVSGAPISPQSDVYSLGIILYELLTDSRPYNFENRSPAGIVGVICESEPEKPSTVAAHRKTSRNGQKINSQTQPPNVLSKELDFIILKSLRKDAARRYASVKNFAADIERFQNGFPVKAAPDNLIYSSRKFLRRNRKISAAIAAGLLLICAAPLIYFFTAHQPNAAVSTRKDAARRVTFGSANDKYPQILPDGRIAFVRTTQNVEKIRAGDTTSRFFVINSDGTNEHLLNESLLADRGRFSNDGAKFVYRGTNDYRLYTTDTDFKSPKKITRYAAGHPTFSPDKSRVIFSYNLSEKLEEPAIPLYRDADNVEIFSVNFDDTNETNLTNNPAFDSDAAVSPDGARIAFTSNRDGNFEIYTMNSDGSNQRRLTDNQADDVLPAFSPDGKRIAFVSRRDDSHDEIFIMNADGTNPMHLTFSDGEDREPAWSPDGKQIVFSCESGGGSAIYLIDVPDK